MIGTLFTCPHFEASTFFSVNGCKKYKKLISINLSKNEKLLYTFVNQTIIFILTVQFKAALTLQLIITSTLFKRRQKSKVEFKHLLHFHKAYLSTKSKT